MRFQGMHVQNGNAVYLPKQQHDTTRRDSSWALEFTSSNNCGMPSRAQARTSAVSDRNKLTVGVRSERDEAAPTAPIAQLHRMIGS